VETVYQHAIAFELPLRGLGFEQQSSVGVLVDGLQRFVR
jgi:hypothetical protein